MTNRLAASIFILLMSIATARAADDIVGPLRTQWGITRDLVVNLVQIMPEEKYDYRKSARFARMSATSFWRIIPS